LSNYTLTNLINNKSHKVSKNKFNILPYILIHRGRNFKDGDTGENHYAIAIVQADGNWDLEMNINNGDAGDVFPGKYGVTELSTEIKSNPNTLSYYNWGINNKGITGLTIENIVEEVDGNVTFDIFFK